MPVNSCWTSTGFTKAGYFTGLEDKMVNTFLIIKLKEEHESISLKLIEAVPSRSRTSSSNRKPINTRNSPQTWRSLLRNSKPKKLKSRSLSWRKGWRWQLRRSTRSWARNKLSWRRQGCMNTRWSADMWCFRHTIVGICRQDVEKAHEDRAFETLMEGEVLDDGVTEADIANADTRVELSGLKDDDVAVWCHL